MSIKDTANTVAQGAVNEAFHGRFISGTKVPTTERHVTRDQLFTIVRAAIVSAIRIEKGLSEGKETTCD